MSSLCTCIAIHVVCVVEYVVYMQFVCYCLSRGTAVGVANVQGEDQKKLDVLANDLFINMLKSSFEVRIYTLRTETAQRLHRDLN